MVERLVKKEKKWCHLAMIVFPSLFLFFPPLHFSSLVRTKLFMERASLVLIASWWCSSMLWKFYFMSSLFHLLWDFINIVIVVCKLSKKSWWLRILLTAQKKNYYKAWQRLSSVFKGLKCDIVEEEIKTCINLRSKSF